ncbi:hypothetical protein J2797_006427 [Paraburkholderia terricola]|uniref:hypothetical protein n=1 Tax=Paraburkholderia terricola TaxID=169427 RepID=UPI0028557400|nr:hypothetical protein [Paraburkholderia terricola]MDR6496500.1 hypothetical protein [Paraburkholderia terricola]
MNSVNNVLLAEFVSNKAIHPFRNQSEALPGLSAEKNADAFIVLSKGDASDMRLVSDSARPFPRSRAREAWW